jgi:hypothetical protein
LGDFYLVSLDGVISMAPHISPFLFWQTRGWNQGLSLVWQVLYHLSHSARTHTHFESMHCFLFLPKTQGFSLNVTRICFIILYVIYHLFYLPQRHFLDWDFTRISIAPCNFCTFSVVHGETIPKHCFTLGKNLSYRF